MLPPPPDAFGVCPPPPSCGERARGVRGVRVRGTPFPRAPATPLDISVADVV